MIARTATLLALILACGCAASGPKQTYEVRFGIIELPRIRMGEMTEALPVEPSRVISIRPRESSKDSASRSSHRTLGVTIVPSGRGQYVNQIIYYPPEPPERIGSLDGGHYQPAASVVTNGITEGKRLDRGPRTFVIWFDKGDPAGTWRVEVFIDGEARLAETFEVVKP